MSLKGMSKEIDVPADVALVDHNLAPLSSRRGISMLGLIHRIVLGKAPPQFHSYIYPARGSGHSRGWAFSYARHTKQLHDPIDGAGPRILGRSFLTLIYSYNALPQHVVDQQTVKAFQRALQKALKKCAASGYAGWQGLLQDGARARGTTFFRKWFET